MAIMVALEFPLQDGKQAEFLELLGGALPDTRVIPPFVGLFETRITRPIYTGSVS